MGMNKILKHIKNRLALCLFSTLCMLLPVERLMAQSWPTESEWIPMIDAAWSPLQDGNDQRKDYADIVVDQYGHDSYFYSTESTLYLRITLQGTTLKRGSLNSWTWSAALDGNSDGFPDWSIIADGRSEKLLTFYNSSADNNPEIEYYSLSKPVSSGEVREVDAGYSQYSKCRYLDFQVPFSSLQISGYENNITPYIPFKMLYITARNADLSFDDMTGNSNSLSSGFSNAPPIARGHYGSINDARDPQPYSNEGLWTSPESIILEGYGWPNSGSASFTGGVRNIRILNSSGSLAWYGTATTDVNGVLSPTSLWTIDNTVGAGTYTITVENPLQAGVYYAYDTFTITVPPPTVPEISISKLASVSTLSAGSELDYTITLTNSGSGSATSSEIRDMLPNGFSYIPGSTAGFTSIDPVIVGQELVWYGNWDINPPSSPPNSIELNFSVTTTSLAGDYTNLASAMGTNFALVETGPTALVTLTAPEPGVPDLSISCSTPSDTVTSSSPLEYLIRISNNGTATATITTIQDELPVGFSYVPGSTSGLSTSDPSISGSQLIWSGEWQVSELAGSNIDSLRFTVRAPMVSDQYFNSVSLAGSDFDPVNSGPVAPVYVAVPHLSLAKSVDNAYSIPGDTLSYSVTYLNSGDASAKMIIIMEGIPAQTTYLENSAAGSGTVISYSHDGGFSYDSDPTAPVTHIQYQRSADLAPGASGNVSYKVLVQ